MGSETIRFARGTAAQWAASTRVLKSGEPGYETDTGIFRIGDGVSLWPALPAVSASSAPVLRSQIAADWESVVFSTHAALTSETLTFEHGRAVIRGDAGTGARSNRRIVRRIPNSPGGHSRIKARIHGPVGAGTTVPQWGLMHGLGTQADGNVYGVIVWTDIVINNVVSLNYGIWRAEGGPAGSFQAGGGLHIENVAFTGGSRATNLVTLTGIASHTFRPGDIVNVDAADNGYDGTFEITAVTATTITYWQAAADDASSGAGTVTPAWQTPGVHLGERTYSVEASSRTNRIVSLTIGEAHALAPGDPIGVDLADATYDGNFIVQQAVIGTVRYYQNAADDADGGTGTISKKLPFWIESEWLPGDILRARAWPDAGIGAMPIDTASGAGAAWNGPPPWDSPGSFTVSLAGLLNPAPDPAFGDSCAIVGAHLAGGATPTEVRYDNIETTAL